MSSEKECPTNANIDKCTVVLLDVAGTTTSQAFVKETLFAFATDHVHSFLKDSWEDEEVKKALKLLQEGDTELEVDNAVEVFKKSTGENSDNKGLKILQGLIYKKGYTDKTLKAHVFSDVPKAFENWSKERKIVIYSTGSVDSQKLLFAHSTEGDLSGSISHYFDQSVGVKTESESYKKVAEELNVKTEEILFINDNIDELKAAKEAGLTPVLVKREGNEEISEEALKDITVISSFAELSFDNSNKRKSEEEIDGTEAPPAKIAKKDEQQSEGASTTESAEIIKETPEAVETKSQPAEEKAEIEKTPEVIEEKIGTVEKKLGEEIEKSENKVQPAEETNLEPEIEPMEVDTPEIENAVAAEENKIDSTTENDSSNANPKEKVAKEINVTEAMETEQSIENDNADSKIVTEPVLSKTDEEMSTEPADKEEATKSNTESAELVEKETIETENKTEESDPKKDVEVASNSDTVDVKENGVEILEVEISEKEATANEIENVEVAEEAMEEVKVNDQNSELAQDSTEVAEEATEHSNDAEVCSTAVTNKDDKENRSEISAASASENKEELKETEQEEITEQQKIEPVKEDEPVKESSQTCKETIKKATEEPQEHVDENNVTKGQKQETTKKSSENTSDVAECSKESEQPTAAEQSSDEVKEPVIEKCSEETSATAEKCSEESKETTDEDNTKSPKNEVTHSTNIISETMTKEIKDNTKEPVKAQETASESKIGNGSCDLNTAADVTKNGDVTNGQENDDEKNDETDPEDTDIKIKKLETSAGSPAVSVEV